MQEKQLGWYHNFKSTRPPLFNTEAVDLIFNDRI